MEAAVGTYSNLHKRLLEIHFRKIRKLLGHDRALSVSDILFNVCMYLKART